MAKEKIKEPPLYIPITYQCHIHEMTRRLVGPSSGSMVRVKFKISSGLANVVSMVLGRESSVKSTKNKD
jgi:hypothetical protein